MKYPMYSADRPTLILRTREIAKCERGAVTTEKVVIIICLLLIAGVSAIKPFAQVSMIFSGSAAEVTLPRCGVDSVTITKTGTTITTGKPQGIDECDGRDIVVGAARLPDGFDGESDGGGGADGDDGKIADFEKTGQSGGI